MRVLMVCQRFPPLAVSGAPLQAIQLARALAYDGVHVEVLATASGSADDTTEDGVRTVRLPAALHSLGRPALFAATAAWVARHGRRFDVVHAHALSASALGALAGAGGRLPVLVKPSLPGPDGDIATLRRSRLAPVATRLAARFDHYVVLHDEIERELDELAVPRERRTRTDNGVDLGRFRPALPIERSEVRRELGLSPDAPVVVFVGQLTARKGLDVLMDAMTRLRERVPNAELLVAGGGPLAADLRAREADWLHLVGVRDDVERVLGAADVFALPSRAESFGNATVEALACGLPAIVSESAIPGGLRPSGEIGDVVPTGDSAALAGALFRHLGAVANGRESVATYARAAVERFAFPLVAARYLELYDRLARTR